MSVTFTHPVLIQFPSIPCFMRRCTYFLLQNSCFVCRRRLSPFVSLERARCTNKVGGGWWVLVARVAKNCSQICVQNYSGVRFIQPTRDPMRGPSPGPGTAGCWKVELCRSCVSMTLQQQLKSDCYSILTRGKWVRPFICHEPTRILKYDQGLPPQHAIKRKTKGEFFFCFLWWCLPRLSFFVNYHWARRITIASNLQVSVLESLILTLIIKHFKIVWVNALVLG